MKTALFILGFTFLIISGTYLISPPYQSPNLSIPEKENKENDFIALERREEGQVEKEKELKELEHPPEYKTYLKEFNSRKKRIQNESKNIIHMSPEEISTYLGTPLAGYILAYKAKQIYKFLDRENLPEGLREFLEPLQEEYRIYKKEYSRLLFADAQRMRETMTGSVFPMPRNKNGRLTPSMGTTITSTTIDNMGGWYTIHYYGDNPEADILCQKMTANLSKAQTLLNNFGIVFLKK